MREETRRPLAARFARPNSRACSQANKSPIQGYVQPEDHTQPTDDMTPRKEKNRIIYLMSKTRKVFAQSSYPEAHVKNSRQTKLVIVDTTAAPALYIVGQQYSYSLCSSLKYTDS